MLLRTELSTSSPVLFEAPAMVEALRLPPPEL